MLQVLELVVDLLEQRVPLVAGLGFSPPLRFRGVVSGHLRIRLRDPEVDIHSGTRRSSLAKSKLRSGSKTTRSGSMSGLVGLVIVLNT